MCMMAYYVYPMEIDNNPHLNSEDTKYILKTIKELDEYCFKYL